MNTAANKELYNKWSETYDDVENPTRDLEAQACRETLGPLEFGNVLELGSGTGKNTQWLASKAKRVVSVDLSPEMQAVAKREAAANVAFVLADISKPWEFGGGGFDLITASLVLEHIADLGHIFAEASAAINPKGAFYISELHPFKQYAGSKARFGSEGRELVLDCFKHHISDFTKAADECGFSIESIEEWFDGGDRNALPRLITFVFRLR